MKKKYLFTVLINIIMFGFVKSQNMQLETVQNVDLNKYIGKWYEIALYPNRFEKDCYCTTAEYELTSKKYIKVTNTCRKKSINGEIKSIVGKAFVVEGSGNAKLKVQFFFPFKGDYWIIDLADDYSYAVVSEKTMKYLWILSRTSKMNEEIYESILKKIELKGFDIQRIVKTEQI